MSRFFVEQSAISEDIVTITGDDVNHIRKVLRLRPGDTITVCGGNGFDYSADIDSIESSVVKAKITSTQQAKTEPPIEVVLFQGLPKSDKMDLIVQKSIELGVKRIIPVITQRTVVKIDNGKDAENKRARWQRIALEASKQCNRGVVPEVHLPVSFQQAVNLSENYDLRIIPYENERVNRLKECLKAHNGIKTIAVFIGPEGGFSEDEIKSLNLNKIIPVTLGPRILRTETAGIAVLSILMYELGDVG